MAQQKAQTQNFQAASKRNTLGLSSAQLQLAIFRMNTKLQTLLLTLALLSSMVSEGDSFSSAGRHVGRKRSITQVKTAKYLRKQTIRLLMRLFCLRPAICRSLLLQSAFLL